MASVCAFLLLPANFAAAEEIEQAPETLVSPSDSNEGELDYLMLADSFVTVERIPSDRLDTPANVIVITESQIAANHYKNITEAIAHVNGAYAWNLNGSDRLVILVDGHRANFSPPMPTIERIEIIKGGMSAPYGSEAVGGVINIITKKGTAEQTTLDFATGSWHTHEYQIMNEGNSGKFSWLVFGGMLDSRPFKFKDNGYDVQHISELTSDNDKNDVFLKLSNRINDNNSVDISFQHHTNRNNKYGQYAPSTVGEDDLGNTYLDFMFNLSEWKDDTFSLVDGLHSDTYFYDKSNEWSFTYNFKENTKVPGFLRYIDTYEVSRNSDTVESATSRLQGVDYQNGWDFGKHKLILGAEWHRLENSGWILDNKRYRTINTAYYIQDTMSLGDKWTFIPGVRLDHNGNFGNQWSPKVALNYRADDNTKIFASWGKAYKAPNPYQLYMAKVDLRFIPSYLGSTERYAYIASTTEGNRNLEPETGHAEHIGFEHSFEDRAVLRFNLFQNNLNDIIDMAYVSTSYPNDDTIWDTNRYTNNNKDKHRGVELSYAQKIDDKWSYDVGYIYTHTEGERYDDPNWANFTVPKHSYHLGLHYDNGAFKANLFGIMGSGFNKERFYPTKYARFDLNISYDLTDWTTIYLKGQNLTNQSYSYHYKTIHEPGRFFMAGAQFKF